MVTPSAGSVVLVRFPFSDLSSSKLRPAIVMAPAGRQDWILCQVTSNPYADSEALELTDSDFVSGSLKRVSYARPTKLFTANHEIMVSVVGSLSQAPFTRVVERTIDALRTAINR